MRDLRSDIPIRRAAIAVAGSGTRFLPATKAIPKEMLPLVDRPIVQVVVEEMADSGIEDVVFVTRWDKKVLEDHFDTHKTLESELAAAGKAKFLKETRKPAELVNAVYIRQKGPYGNGTPALNAGKLISDEVFVYAFGDDLVSSSTPFVQSLIEQYRKTPGLILGVQEVPKAEVVNYGMVAFDPDTHLVNAIIEKPSLDQVTSTWVSFGRYILPQRVVEILDTMPTGKNDELWLMDAVEAYRDEGGKVYACPVRDGRWFTTGDPANYLEALFHFGLQRDDLRDTFRSLIQRYAREMTDDA